jgi:amino acid transporter
MVTQSRECPEFVQGSITTIVSAFLSCTRRGLVTVRSVAVTGIAVLAGFTRISDPFANFHNVWQGSTTNPNAVATSLVKTNFAYVGWANAFNLLGEVNGTSPVRTVRNAGFISLGVVMILFLTVNVAYIAAVPIDEIKNSGQLVGALFFQRVFGGHWAPKILPVLVALSCVGNIVSEVSDLIPLCFRLRPRSVNRSRS